MLNSRYEINRRISKRTKTGPCSKQLSIKSQPSRELSEKRDRGDARKSSTYNNTTSRRLRTRKLKRI